MMVHGGLRWGSDRVVLATCHGAMAGAPVEGWVRQVVALGALPHGTAGSQVIHHDDLVSWHVGSLGIRGTTRIGSWRRGGMHRRVAGWR